jgi:hypothetical protein
MQTTQPHTPSTYLYTPIPKPISGIKLYDHALSCKECGWVARERESMRKHINQRHLGQLDTISTGHQCHQVFGSLHKTYILITNAVVPSVPLAHSLDAGLQLYTKVHQASHQLEFIPAATNPTTITSFMRRTGWYKQTEGMRTAEIQRAVVPPMEDESDILSYRCARILLGRIISR